MGALSASSSCFPCESRPSALCRLLVSSAPAGFQGHLRLSSNPRRVPSSCIILGVGCPLGASSSSFTYKSRTVLSALGVLSTKMTPDHLHSSCTKNVPLSCITSGCPQHWVPSQGISILHMQAVPLHRVSSLGIRGTWCPPRASACSFTCQPPPSISHQPLILVFSALDALPGHLCPSHARPLDLSVTISWCLWHQDIDVLCKPPPSILHLLVSLVLAALLGHLCAPSCTNQLQPP